MAYDLQIIRAAKAAARAFQASGQLPEDTQGSDYAKAAQDYACDAYKEFAGEWMGRADDDGLTIFRTAFGWELDGLLNGASFSQKGWLSACADL